MPDPRGAKRLLPYGCKCRWKKTTMEVPVRVEDPDDYRPGTKKPRLVKKDIWMVELELPKYLINDIRQGSMELEDMDIDMGDLDNAYEQDLDLAQHQDQEQD